MTTGSIYVEVDGHVNTGLAFANVSDTEARVTFQVNRANGETAGSGELIIPPRSQVARFLSEAPFKVQNLAAVALTFNSTLPIAVLGLRGHANERNEFLLSTLPVSGAVVAEPVYKAHFANGGGWTTQINC